MTARTIQTPATLRRDTRFQAATPGEKWVYGHLCDRDEVVAEPGLDVLGTVVLIVEGLGDTPRGVLAPLLEGLAGRGLVTMEPKRLVIHPPQTTADRRGPRGGKSSAERMAELRARRATADVTAKSVTVTGNVTDRPVTTNPSRDGRSDGAAAESVTQSVTVTDSAVTSDPSHPAKSDGVTDSIRHVTGNVTGNPSLSPSRDGQCDGFEGSGGSPALPEVPPSHTLPSPTSPPPPTDEALHLAREVRALEARTEPGGQRTLPGAEPSKPATAPKAKKPAPADASAPLPGTPAAASLAALSRSPLLLSAVAMPHRLCESISAGAYPAVNVPREILAAEAWLAANPANAKKNGARFLTNWLSRAQERAPRVTAPTAPTADARGRRMVGPAPVGTPGEFARSASDVDPLKQILEGTFR